MCGIAGGLWSLSAVAPTNATRISGALQAMRHRGPDDSGEVCIELATGIATLGQTRLSIIDLSAGGHQPMSTPDGMLTVVFNGEIYNYRELRSELTALGHHFHTQSDTEVLLHSWREWAEQSLTRFVGMFAFALLDHRSETLYCARDAFGIKPFFYSTDNHHFAFASEIRALESLLDRRCDMNLQRMYDYLVFEKYDHTQETFKAGIYQLPSGHVLKVTSADGIITTASRRWWWPAVTERAIGFEEAASELRERFLESIRLHLRSDVPVGAALSGGIDSSAVVSAMRHVEPDAELHTFCYAARGTGIDEEPWADLVNAATGAHAHKIVLGADDLAANLDDMILAQGEPFGSTSIFAQYSVYRLARESGITVTLDGQGADELLAGYTGYPAARISSLWRTGHPLQAAAFAREWASWPGRSLRSVVPGIGSDLLPDWSMGFAHRLNGRSPEPEWINADACRLLNVTPAAPALPKDTPIRGRRLVQRLRRSLTGGELAVLLRHGDRNSMRWSIESRVPFLTPGLAEFCLSLPEEYLISPQGETKHVFRRAMRGIVPDAVLDRRDKIGFQTPEQAWLRQLQPQISEWLSGLDHIPIVDATHARRLVLDMLSDIRPFNWTAWRLINAARWAQVAA